MLEVVALIEVPDGDHMLLQNLQIFGSSQGNVLGEEEKTSPQLFPLKKGPYNYTPRVIHRIDSGFRVIS